MFGMDGYWYAEELSKILFGANVVSPGVVKLSGHDRPRKWDVQEPKGASGGSSQLGGKPIGKFTATFSLTNEVQPGGRTDFDDWEDFQQYLDSLTEGSKPIAVPVYHPDLARQKFTEVSVEKVYGLVHDGFGGATVQVDFIEYRPPKPAPAKKAAAKPSGATPGGVRQGTTTIEKPDPNAEAKAELAALLEQAKGP